MINEFLKLSPELRGRTLKVPSILKLVDQIVS